MACKHFARFIEITQPIFPFRFELQTLNTCRKICVFDADANHVKNKLLHIFRRSIIDSSATPKTNANIIECWAHNEYDENVCFSNSYSFQCAMKALCAYLRAFVFGIIGPSCIR